MAGLKPGIKALFKQLKVRVDNPDGDTLLLHNVPVDPLSFSKPQTNVLVKRPRAGLPYLLCVDEDLEYVGPDRELARTFASAGRQQGWLVVSGAYPQADDAVQHALALLGVGDDSPAPAASPAGLLSRFGVNLTAQLREGAAEQTVGRNEAAEQIAASMLSWQRRLAVVLGAPGLGKSNLLHKVAANLAEVRPEWELISMDLAMLLAGVLFEGEREKLLNTVLDEAIARDKTLLVLERMELAVMTVPLTPWLLASALDRGARLAATCLPPHLEKLNVDPIARRIDPVEITELAREDVVTVLGHLRDTLAAHHRVAIDGSVVEAAAARSQSLAGLYPDKAITLLDAAAARAALLKQSEVTMFDVYLAASRMKEV